MLKKNNQSHSFHLVDPSPWPIITAFSIFLLTFGGVMYMHGYCGGNYLLKFGIIMILLMMWSWWGDIIRESTFEGQHTKSVQKSLRIGVILFIISEIMFFVAFFWAFFHSSLNPGLAIGGVWPPAFLIPLSPWGIPLLNTLILLSSGASITWAHHSLVGGFKTETEFGLTVTVILALIFLMYQVIEYKTASFSISDGIYGSTFYMTTGFHGLHVFIGLIFLIICKYRLDMGHFTQTHHFGFEAAAWYWHFVDVVWLFLFITIYWWGC